MILTLDIFVLNPTMYIMQVWQHVWILGGLIANSHIHYDAFDSMGL
jgi:hypothetical protein